MFLLWPDVPGLLIARFITGLGVGALTATATAHLNELKTASRADGKSGNAATIANVANIGGLALGPLIGGLFAEFTNVPLVAPYVTYIALFVLAAFAVAFVPETVADRPGPTRYRPQSIALPATSRGAFWSAGAGAFAGFSVFGLFTSLAPTFLITTFHVTDRLVAGAVSFAAFAPPLSLRSSSPDWDSACGSSWAPPPWPSESRRSPSARSPEFSPCSSSEAIIAGGGVGLLFRAALEQIGSMATPEHRGEVLAAAFLISYAGLTIPVLCIGVALLAWQPVPVLLGFSATILVLAVVAGSLMARRSKTARGRRRAACT